MEKKLKILFIFWGVHHNIRDTLSVLSKKWDVHIAHIKGCDDIEGGSIPGITVHEIKNFKKFKALSSEYFIPDLREYYKILSQGYDCIIFKNIFDPMSLIGFLICKLKKINFIFSEQKIKKPKGIFGAVAWLIENIYLKYLINIKKMPAYAPTATAYKQLSKITRVRYYIPFAVDLSQYRLHRFKRRGTLKILNVSTFQKRKDQTLLIQAVYLLAKKYKKIKFKLTLIGGVNLGRSYLTEIKTLAKKLKVECNIIEHIPNELLKKKYADFDIFVLSSYDEPAAFSHLEAMASGIPVICSDENGTKGYIKEGQNGYVFKARNVADLAQKIELIAVNQESLNWKKLIQFGIRSRGIACSNHSQKVISDLFEKMINNSVYR